MKDSSGTVILKLPAALKATWQAHASKQGLTLTAWALRGLRNQYLQDNADDAAVAKGASCGEPKASP